MQEGEDTSPWEMREGWEGSGATDGLNPGIEGGWEWVVGRKIDQRSEDQSHNNDAPVNIIYARKGNEWNGECRGERFFAWV